MIKLTTLKNKGFALTQSEAQELQPVINRISQHGIDGYNEVYPVGNDADSPEYLQAYYRELADKNAELVKRVAELEGKLKDVTVPLVTPIIEQHKRTYTRKK